MAVSRVHVRAHPGERAYDRMVAALRGLMKDGPVSGHPGVDVYAAAVFRLGILPRPAQNGDDAVQVAGDARGGQQLDRVHAPHEGPRGAKHLRGAETSSLDGHAERGEAFSVRGVGVAAVLEHPVQQLRAPVHGGGHHHVGPALESRG